MAKLDPQVDSVTGVNDPVSSFATLGRLAKDPDSLKPADLIPGSDFAGTSRDDFLSNEEQISLYGAHGDPLDVSAKFDFEGDIQRLRVGFLSNNQIPYFDAQLAYESPVGIDGVISARVQNTIDAVKVWEAEGFENPFVNGDVRQAWTAVDLVSLTTGIVTDHRIAHEANMALWEEKRLAGQAYARQVAQNSTPLEESEVWNYFVDNEGKELGEDFIEAMMFTFQDNVDDENRDRTIADLGNLYNANPTAYQGIDGRNRLLVEWVQKSGAASFAYQVESKQVTVEAPGWAEAFLAVKDMTEGLLDVLPEERFGLDFDAPIVGSFGTVMGALSGTTVGGALLGLAETVFTPIDKYITYPIKGGIASMFMGDIEADPYRAYMTAGQLIAQGVGFEYGSDGFHNMSGSIDAGLVLAFDPLTYLMPISKGMRVAAKGMRATDVVGLFGRKGRFALAGRAIIPNRLQRKLFGDVLPYSAKGMRGPLTRASFYLFSNNIDEMIIGGSKHIPKWLPTPRGAAVRRGNQFVQNGIEMIGDDTDAFARLYNLDEAQGFVKTLETKLADFDDMAVREQVFREVWLESAKGAIPDKKSVTYTQISNLVDDKAKAVNDEVERLMRSGEISATDFKTALVGDHAWDGMFGFKLNEKGRLIPVALDGTKGNVLLFPKSVKRIEYDDLKRLAQHQDAPLDLKDMFRFSDEASQVQFFENLDEWGKTKIFDWLEANGSYRGFIIGNRNSFFSDNAMRHSVQAVDGESTGLVNELLGSRIDEFYSAEGALMDIGAATDNLDVIINFTRPGLSGQVYRKISRGFKGLNSKDPGISRWRRNIGELTARTQNFPQAVNWRDLSRGVKQLRAIALRMGFADDATEAFVKRFRDAPYDGRFFVLADIRREMLVKTKNWRALHYADGLGNDLDAFYGVGLDGHAIMRGESKSREGLKVSKAYQPSQFNNAVEFFSESFYQELGRLTAARARQGHWTSVFNTGFGKTSKNRTALATRYRTMLQDVIPDKVWIEEGIDEDLFNMAYATIAKFNTEDIAALGAGINGLGQISRASKLVSRWWALAHSQFSVMTLGLRAPSWGNKVAVFEEPIRGQLTGSNRWYSAPLGALKNTVESAYVRQIQRQVDAIPEVLGAMRASITSQLDGIDELVELVRRAKQILPDIDLPENPSLWQVREAINNGLEYELRNFNPTLNGRLSLVTANEKLVHKIEKAKNLSEVSEFGWDLNDILSMGYDNVDIAAAKSIYQGSVSEQFVQRIRISRGEPIPFNPGGSLDDYALGKATTSIDDAADPFHRFAIRDQLARMTNDTRPNPQELITGHYWMQGRANFRAGMVEDGVNYVNELQMAEWYLREVQAKAIDAKWSVFWENTDLTKQEVLEGVLAKRIKFNANGKDYTMPLYSEGAPAFASTYKRFLDDQIKAGAPLDAIERTVYGKMDLARDNAQWQDWKKYAAVREGLQAVNRSGFGPIRLTTAEQLDGTIKYGVMEYFGARASENISRLPSWRNLYADHRRTYKAFGWSDEMADSAARTMATEAVNNIYYNSHEMAKWMEKFNEVIPFGAAMLEVAKVWMWDIPKDYLGHGGVLGWATGTMELQRRWQYVMQAFEGLGLVGFEFDEESGHYLRHIVLDETSDSFWNRLALKGVKAPSQLGAALAERVTGIEMEEYVRMDFRMGNLTGGPFSTSNQGLFGLSQYQAGFGPIPAWGAGRIAPAVFGLPETIKYDGGSVSDFLADNNMEMEDFLSVADNREALLEKGVALGELNQILAMLRDNPDDNLSLDLLAQLGGISDVILPKGTYRKSNPGSQLGVFQDYIQPFGAPATMAEAIGDYLPSGIQSGLMGLETLMIDKDAWSPSEFFFGPSAAYTHDREYLYGIMVQGLATGNLDKWQGLLNRGAALRLEAIESGLAEIVRDREDKGPRLSWIVYGPETTALQDELKEINGSILNVYETLAGDGLTYSAGSHLMRALTQMSLPSQPQRFTGNQLDVHNFWASKEMAEGVKAGLGPEAFQRWQQAMSTPEQMTKFVDVVLEWLKEPEWNPEADDRAAAYYTQLNENNDVKNALRSNPALANLHYYLTPTKVYPTGYVQTETIEEWADLVDQGALQFSDPRVYAMRVFNAELSWEAQVERSAFYEGATWEKALTNGDEYKLMNMDIRNRRDYLKLVDEEVFEGAYREAFETLEQVNEGKKDSDMIVRDQVLARWERDIALLTRLIDDVDKLFIDPTRAEEAKGTLQAIRAGIFDIVETLNVADEYFAVSPEQRALSQWYDTVAAPYYGVLSELYTKVDEADSDWQRTMAYEAIRTFENNQFAARPLIAGVQTFNALTLKEHKLVAAAKETGWQGSDLEQVARKSLGLKVDWLSWSDVSILARYVDMSGGDLGALRNVLPHSPDQWLPYIERNTQYALIEADRLAGNILDKQAKKAKEAVDLEFEAKLKGEIEGYEHRPGELIYQDLTPAEQWLELGILSPGFIQGPDGRSIMGTARQYLDITNSKRWRGSKKDLWNTDYSKRIMTALSRQPQLRAELLQIGLDAYGMTDLNAIAYRFFLGKFGNL